MDILNLLNGFNVWSILARVLLATICGGIIGLEREKHGRAAGLRTHIIICVGSALTSLVGLYAVNVLGTGGDAFRISAQVVSGVGFLGVGMIMVRNRTVITGLTTAAGLWATAIIGIAVGYGFYLGALATTAICVASVVLFGIFESKGKSVTVFYIEVSATDKTTEVVKELKSSFDTDITVDVVAPKSTAADHVGLLLHVKTARTSAETLSLIEKIENINFVVEQSNS